MGLDLPVTETGFPLRTHSSQTVKSEVCLTCFVIPSFCIFRLSEKMQLKFILGLACFYFFFFFFISPPPFLSN